VRAPTPTDLDLAPELAILAALENTGELARTAIISARAELRDPDTGQLPLFSEDATGAVRTLMTLIDALLEQIEVYRDKVEAEHRRTGRARSNTF
jgi:hypothetical protein